MVLKALALQRSIMVTIIVGQQWCRQCLLQWQKWLLRLNGLMAISVLMNYCKNPLNGCSGWKDLNNKDVWNCTKGLNDNQTWKKARTRGHCPRKFLRIAEIFWLWKIMHLYFQKKTYFLWKCLMKHLIFGISIAYRWRFPQ